MDVGNCSAGFEEDAAAAEVGQLALDASDMFGAEGELHIDAVGGECLVEDYALRLGDPQLEQGQFTERAAAFQFGTTYQQALRRLLQALVGPAAVGPGQAAGTQLDAALPADHQNHDLIAILGLDGGEDRPARRAAGFAVVTAAVLGADLPGPAIVGGGEVAVLFEEGLGVGRRADRRGEGDETALANLFAKFAGVQQGRRHKRVFSSAASGHSP